MSSTGVIVPSALETWVTATSFVRGAEQPLEFLEQELAGVVDRRDLEHDAEAVAQHLPGHDVGVVLQLGDHDLVAGLEDSRRPSCRRPG